MTDRQCELHSEAMQRGKAENVSRRTICHLTTAGRERIPRLNREVASSAQDGYKNYIVCVGKNDENEHTEFVGVPAASGRLERFGRLSRDVYRAGAALDADIYQIHEPELLRFAGKLKRSGKRVIFDSHENYLTRINDREWIPKPCRRILNTLFLLYFKRELAKVDAVLGVNEPIVNSLSKYHRNCILVTNFPILREKTYTDDEKFDGFNLCYTGAVSDQWCLSELMDAMDGIEGVKTRICGVEADGYLTLLRKKPAWSQVEYLGVVTYAEANQIQEQSNVGIAVLKYSNNTNGKLGSMGNTKLFEYFMAGIPVICSGFECWKEIIDRYDCGICVDPNDPADIRKAILTMQSDPDRVRKMGVNARKAAEQTYNWSTQADVLLNVYNNLT